LVVLIGFAAGVNAGPELGDLVQAAWSVYLSWENGRLEPFRASLGREFYSVRPDFAAQVDAAVLLRDAKRVQR